MLNIKNEFSLAKAVTRLKKRYQIESEKAEKSIEPVPVRITGGSLEYRGGMPAQSPPEEAQAGKKESFSGSKYQKIDINSLDVLGKRKISFYSDSIESQYVDTRFALTPAYYKKGDPLYSWGHIKWNPATSSLEYKIIEPPLTEVDKREIKRIKRIMEEKLDVNFEGLKREESKEYIKKNVREIINQFGMYITPKKREIYEYYVLRDFIGFEKIEPLMNDENIEDVSCDGVNIPVFIYHRDPKYGSMKTNIVFNAKDELDDFVMKLAQKCGRSISVAEPLLQGALPDGSRVQSTLETDIARKGSNFTIRKFTNEPLTPVHLMKYGTIDAKTLAYLWLAIENNISALIVGATAAGKTSMLNALSLFIKPSAKIVSIEDTPELRMPHVHWIPEVGRAGFISTKKGEKIGEISLFDLLKASLRQRPDYIIVGEIRGKEAYVLFQQIATGHPGLSTFHADSLEKVIDRLTTKPIELPVSLLETLDMMVFIRRLRYKDKFVRKVVEIDEIEGVNIKEKTLIPNRIFEWDAVKDEIITRNKSFILGKISKTTGVSEDDIKAEISNRMKILEWMYKQDITNYIQVGRVISSYYADAEKTLDLIESGY